MNWYVVATAPGHDYKVHRELAKLLGEGEAWLPECKVRKKYLRSVTTLKGPLFPGYQFIRARPDAANWQKIENLRGVDRVLTRAGADGTPYPCPLRPEDVARLQNLAGDQWLTIEVDGAIRHDFAIGDELELLAGPFAGWKGLLSERVGDRLRVLLDIFGRSTETLIPEALVVPA